MYRQSTTTDGTFGTLVLPTGHIFITGELPWRNNRVKVTCIPVGTYACKSYISSKLGKCYTITNVTNRSGIAFHSANYCGLASEGKRQELQGCIALGLGVGKINKQKIVTSSRAAILKFHTLLNWQPFNLKISNI
jgi:hypothetical protein